MCVCVHAGNGMTRGLWGHCSRWRLLWQVVSGEISGRGETLATSWELPPYLSVVILFGFSFKNQFHALFTEKSLLIPPPPAQVLCLHHMVWFVPYLARL